MFLYELLLMSVKQKIVCVHDDTHPLACNKSQKKVDSKTVENYVLNDSLSVSCARMQVRPVGCGNKEVAQKRCSIRWKPTISGKRERSLSSLDSRDFERRIKEVNIVGLENKVLLVKVMKNGNESGSTLGKHLPKLWKKQCSTAPFQHNLDKLTSSSANRKEKNNDVLKLEKIESDCASGRIHSPVCCASIVVEKNPFQLSRETGHKLGNIQRKTTSVSSEILKDSFQNISKISSKNTSLHSISLNDTVSELDRINACKIVKPNGNGDGSSKAKNAITFLVSKGSVISGNVSRDGTEKIASVPSQKIFKLSQQQLENTSTHVELVEKTVNETYKVKCLKNGRCSIKKMEERPKPSKLFGKDIVAEVNKIDHFVQNDIHMVGETGNDHFKSFSVSTPDVINVPDNDLINDLCHHQNTDNSFGGKDSDIFQDYAHSSSDINDVHVGGMVSDLCHYEYKDDLVPNVNAECFFNSSETEDPRFQTSHSNVTKRWVQQKQCQPSMNSIEEFSVSFSSPSCSVPDMKNLRRESIEKLPDSAECISNTCDQLEPVRQKTAVLMPKAFALHSVPNVSQAVSSDQCNFIDKNSLQNLEEPDLHHIPKRVKENIDGMLAEDNLLQVLRPSEGCCSSYDNRTIKKCDNVPSTCISSNKCSEMANLTVAVPVQNQKNEEKPMLRDSRISSPKEPCAEISASHASTSDVVWTLQTPKPSVTPLLASFSDREVVVNQFTHNSKEKTNCGLFDIGSSESYPSPVYNEIAKIFENETKDVIDMIETISEAIDTGYINESNLVARGCTNDVLNVPANLLELKEEVKIPKKSTETLYPKNSFGTEENEINKCLNPELLHNLDSTNASEMLAITLPQLGNNSSKHSVETDISPVSASSDIDSVFGDITCLPDISSMLTYTGFGYEVTDNVHNHQPTKRNLQTISSDVNTTMTEIWNSLEEVPVDHNMSEQQFNLDVNNSSDFNKLLDSILLEVDQGVVDSGTHNEVCSQPKNEENHIFSNNTLHNSVLTSMNITANSEELVSIKDLGDCSHPQADLENDRIEVPQTHSLGCAKNNSISSKMVQSLPVTTSIGTQKEISHDYTKNEGCGSIARTVSFKTRSATRPIKCVVRGQVVENELQKQARPLRFVLGKDRRLQNQDGSTSWPQREEFNPEQFTVSQRRNISPKWPQNGEQIEDSIPKNSTVISNVNVIPAVSVCIGNVATTITQMKVPGGVLEATKFVLPVGKTGLSITIPTNAPTNITSFFTPPNPVSCVPSATNHAPILPSVKHSSSTNQAVNVTSSVEFKTPSLLTDFPQQRKSVLESEDARRIIIPSTVITVGGKAEAVYQVPIPQNSPAESLYMMVPRSTTAHSAHSNPKSGAPSLLPNILPQHTSEQLSNSNAVISNQVNHCTRQQLITKPIIAPKVPIAPKAPQSKPTTITTSSLPAKVPLALDAETSEPIKILINTKSNYVNTPSSTCSQEKESMEGVTSNDFNKKSESVSILKQKIQKKFNRLLTDELRVHFPDIPESILKVLDLPPQAVRRGYFIMRDLKTLRTQALALRLGIIYKEHVSVCTTQNCSTCFEFHQQQDALSLAEKEQKVSSNSRTKSGTSNRGRSKGQGRRKKNVKVSSEENKSDSNGKSSHCYIFSSKRKLDEMYHMNQLNRTSKVARAGNLIENPIKIPGMFKADDKIKVMDKDYFSGMKMKRSYSDSDIYTHTEIGSVKNDRPYSCDDSYLMIYPTIKSSHCFQNMKWSNSPEVSKESSKNKEILTEDQFRIIQKKKWESHEHANMMMAAVNDLHLRKQLEEDFMPFTEGGTQQNKKLTSGSIPNPLYFDLHSLEIGPLNLAKFEQHFQLRLHVIYTARKFVYELEIKQKPAAVESQNDSPSHLFLTIDVPFSTLQAINITSNLVLLVMNTVPMVQVVDKRGISFVTLSGEDVLSLAQCNYLSHLKAALTIYPVHKVLIRNQGRALILRDGLCGFSDWFAQMMSNSIPLQDDQIPSWSLASPVDACMIASEIIRTPLPGRGDNLSSAENHPVHHRKSDQNTWQEQTNYSAVIEDSNNVMNSTSGPSSAALYLISAVKAALESKGVLHPVPFSPAIQFPLAPYLEKGCTCEETCRIMDCPCARAGALCRTRQTCHCKECDNPLSILHVLGLDVHTARVDECLMQNLYSYNMAGLCSLLASQVILPCCGAATELLHIIPGTVVCNSCGMTVCYSWCSHHIHLQNLCPRNHCLICCSCKPALHTHCQNCHQCTPSTNQGLCANCGTHKLF